MWSAMMEAHEIVTREWFAERIEPGQDLEEVLRAYYRRESEEHESFVEAVAKGPLRRKLEMARRRKAEKHAE